MHWPEKFENRHHSRPKLKTKHLIGEKPVNRLNTTKPKTRRFKSKFPQESDKIKLFRQGLKTQFRSSSAYS